MGREGNSYGVMDTSLEEIFLKITETTCKEEESECVCVHACVCVCVCVWVHVCVCVIVHHIFPRLGHHVTQRNNIK